ncbi:hypothetical protein SEUCBS140593_010328, partial [Sporothrix eucalyptigena]
MTYQAGAAACSSLHETLIPWEVINEHPEDYANSLRYLQFSGQALSKSRYFINNATLYIPVELESGPILEPITSADGPLNILCAQSDRANSAATSLSTASNLVNVTSTSENTYVGYRNLKSFRFLGIPYANPPSRFEYSSLYNKTGETITAQNYGANCAQANDETSSENCLFLNIQTPYLPKSHQRSNLKPVLFTIHGGAYTAGNGGAGFDAGNLASREDIVGVSINYRLSTLGFLAIPGTNVRGNFGIGDQVTALRWVRQNIAFFGGDPERITVIGESAGAGSVKALLGSPPVIKNQLLAGAIAQSNLGGGQGMGPSAAYSTPYSSYYTMNESYAAAGQKIFDGVGCNHTDIRQQIQCLKTVPAHMLVNLPDAARFVVQDGHFVDSKQLNVVTRDSSTANVNVIFGATANDGASSVQYPKGNFTSEADFIVAALEVDMATAHSIIDSQLFPLFSTGNLSLDAFNVTQRILTDIGFSFDRTNGGYDPNNFGATGLSAGPVTPEYPYGNPNLPYFRLHGSEIGFTYGNVEPIRNADDVKAAQLITAYFASFARTGDPNPSESYLRARGYVDTLAGFQKSRP